MGGVVCFGGGLVLLFIVGGAFMGFVWFFGFHLVWVGFFCSSEVARLKQISLEYRYMQIAYFSVRITDFLLTSLPITRNEKHPENLLH